MKAHTLPHRSTKLATRGQSQAARHWKPDKLICRVTAKPAEQKWLRLESSLTAKLRQLCPELEVRVLSETFATPLASEAHCLDIPAQEKTWIRCVVLQCGPQNFVYARTIIPKMHPDNPWHDVHKLGNTPLGEVLFQDNDITRTPFQFNRTKLCHWPYLCSFLDTAQTTQNNGLARRSVFLKQQMPLLLTEVFLPDLRNL